VSIAFLRGLGAATPSTKPSFITAGRCGIPILSENRSFGFWGPESGQLLRIVPSEVLREASWTEPQAEYFLWMTGNTLHVDGGENVVG
jgi:hypothetical protein